MTRYINAGSEESRIDSWPEDGLEVVSQCPICKTADRRLVHSNLEDIVFRVAPGKWALWRCANCRVAYLDPRPTPESIHLAYADYYTHQEGRDKDDYGSLSPSRKLRRRLVNGYTNWHYSTHALPSSVIGVIAAFAAPNLRSVLDRQYRHLPRLPKSGGKLLDVGCGSGIFLSLARKAGWEVVGLDPDPLAVVYAAKPGVPVFQGGIEHFEGRSELFDVITLDHVIEHVHEPVKVLTLCHSLLKPGGQLWLETPNLDSFGHARFQNNWRGLEAPRHLVLFNQRSLDKAFVDAGFAEPRYRRRPSPSARLFQASYAMQLGRSPYEPVAMPKTLQLQAAFVAFADNILPSRREFLTVTARKTGY